MLSGMNQIFTRRHFRLLRLRNSSLPLAVVLLLALAVLLTSLWLEQARVGWLFVVAGCLFVSIALLLWRQLPAVWRDLTHYRQLQQLSRMQLMQHHVSWRFSSPAPELREQCQAVLASQGYRVHVLKGGSQYTLSAIKGKLNRLGFWIAHLSVLFILSGALLDSELWLDLQLSTGKLHAETKHIALNDMPAQSRVPSRSDIAFSGSENVQAGQIIDEVRLVTAQGFLSRHLVYPVSVQQVELDARQHLLENNFVTRVAILDSTRDSPVQAVLGVNRPFRYRGYVYYQQAVEDAGSELSVSMWPLQHASVVPLKFRTQLGAERKLQTRAGGITVHFAKLRPRNVQSVQVEQGSEAVFKNIGPSLIYKVSEAFAVEREFINYLLPIKQNGRYFYISAVREKDNGPSRYIHIPVDKRASLTRFLDLHAAMHDGSKVKRGINKVLKDAAKPGGQSDTKAFATTLHELLVLFREGGFAAIDKNIASRVSRENFAQSQQLSHKLIRSLLYALYLELQADNQLDETSVLFFEDAIPALSSMAELGMPFYIQLQDMQYRPSVKIMVSYRPGEVLFFTGGILLIISLIAIFYSWHRRIWLLFEAKGNETQVSMAGMGGRHKQAFSREFNKLFTQLQKGMQE